VHLQLGHIHEDTKLQSIFLIMLLQQFSALVKLVEYEKREKHSSLIDKYHICVTVKCKYSNATVTPSVMCMDNIDDI
jgi:hypothetical protein